MVASAGAYRWIVGRTVCLAVLLFVLSGALAEPPPERVASINLCADELLLELLPVERIVSLSWLVGDPYLSWYAQRASGIPLNRGSVEEIVALAPDLVVAGPFTAPATIAMLTRLSIPVMRLQQPATIAEIERQVTALGARLGVAQRAAEVLEGMKRTLARLPPGGQTLTGIVYRPNGLTAGPGSLADDVLRRAGVRNGAVELGGAGYRRVDMESIVLHRPDLLIFDHHASAAPSLAVQLLEHPVLHQARAGMRIVHIPAQAWTCGSPRTVEAVLALSAAAQDSL